MTFQKRLLSYFFLLAAVLSILDGAFTLHPDFQIIKYVLLIFSGIIVGVFVTEQRKEILRGGVATLVGGFFFHEVIGVTSANFSSLVTMLFTFLIFIASLTLTLGLVHTLEQLSSLFHVETRKKNKKKSTLTFDYIWSVTILVAVAFSFIILLLELFTLSSTFMTVLLYLDIVITGFFLVDLYILYKHSAGWKDFFRHNYFDIIASVPSIGVLRALKIVRVIRILRASGRSLRLIKLSKVQKTAKFFSKKSAFNSLEQK